jgi:hypothetical protein
MSFNSQLKESTNERLMMLYSIVAFGWTIEDYKAV